MKKLFLFISIFISFLILSGCTNQADNNGDSDKQVMLSGYYTDLYGKLIFLFKENNYYRYGCFDLENGSYYKTKTKTDENKAAVFSVFVDKWYEEDFSPVYENLEDDHEYYSLYQEPELEYKFTESDKACTVFKNNTDIIHCYIVKGIDDKLIYFPDEEAGMPCPCERKDINCTKESGVIYEYDDSESKFIEVPYWGKIILDDITFYCIEVNYD